MKKYFLIFLIFLIIITFNIQTQAWEGLITSIGQNPGGLMIKVSLKDLDLNYVYNPKIKSEELENYQFAILSVGCSQKGLCAADTNFKCELQRTKNIIEVMKKSNYPIIFVHLGGQLRRDLRSNELIEVIAPHASHLVITEKSNYDNYFSELSENQNIGLHIIDNLSHIKNVFTEIFEKYKF